MYSWNEDILKNPHNNETLLKSSTTHNPLLPPPYNKSQNYKKIYILKTQGDKSTFFVILFIVYFFGMVEWFRRGLRERVIFFHYSTFFFNFQNRNICSSLLLASLSSKCFFLRLGLKFKSRPLKKDHQR